ncbi:MAG: hypothetical protein M0Z42_04760 [Actinomycetota bacterium]|nr:hypothetical protein [Actinomycetota bacterium]
MERIPHKNSYVTTDAGIRFAVFYSKLGQRLLRPLLEADAPPARPEVRAALRTLERAVADYVTSARIGAAA